MKTKQLHFVTRARQDIQVKISPSHYCAGYRSGKKSLKMEKCQHNRSVLGEKWFCVVFENEKVGLQNESVSDVEIEEWENALLIEGRPKYNFNNGSWVLLLPDDFTYASPTQACRIS